jgi:hypothetical protein
MTTEKKVKDWDSPENEVKSNWIKWGVPMEDKLLGTLTRKWQSESQFDGKKGEMQNNYDFKIEAGSFHDLDDSFKPVKDPTVLVAGDIWTVGGRVSMDNQMTNIKVGQIIGLKYVEEKKGKKGRYPAKIIKVYVLKNDDGTLKMDTAWLEERSTPDQKFDNYGK